MAYRLVNRWLGIRCRHSDTSNSIQLVTHPRPRINSVTDAESPADARASVLTEPPARSDNATSSRLEKHATGISRARSRHAAREALGPMSATAAPLCPILTGRTLCKIGGLALVAAACRSGAAPARPATRRGFVNGRLAAVAQVLAGALMSAAAGQLPAAGLPPAAVVTAVASDGLG